MLWVGILLGRGVLNTTLCDKVCQKMFKDSKNVYFLLNKQKSCWNIMLPHLDSVNALFIMYTICWFSTLYCLYWSMYNLLPHINHMSFQSQQGSPLFYDWINYLTTLYGEMTQDQDCLPVQWFYISGNILFQKSCIQQTRFKWNNTNFWKGC
jgi:hypothetical protein